MSNVHRVLIKGKIPFDFLQRGPDDIDSQCRTYQFFAQMNIPTMGIKISYSPNVVEYRLNEFNGQTAYYEFEISGDEAISYFWYNTLLKVLEVVNAEISFSSCIDLENLY